MEAVSAFLQTYDTDYNLMAISNQTLAKLLAGKFKTFEELDDYNNDNIDYSSKIRILYKELKSTNRYIYIIETIFTYE
ncbi:hypothetical protein V2605_05800 [Tenacibaculum maritimum]|uniref:hypothetical protein n=1 Tax=Tenacibaculum maritimum TaxID=107401 RepID=UPI0012E53826|nr:hypothetical protein [Tenacibaculum maritimum]CAA0217818.1 conserved hypothetical protein [Tenacibaculum maritimum]